MKYICFHCFLLTLLIWANSIVPQDTAKYFNNSEFTFSEISGIGFEEGVTRREPSDVIKVGQTYYVYYTKIPDAQPKYRGAGYWGASVWCAKSEDEGFTWKELGQMLDVGESGQWDSQAVFYPKYFGCGKEILSLLHRCETHTWKCRWGI
jgi:hypothetical protein